MQDYIKRKIMEMKESVLDNFTVTNPKGKYLYETHCHTNLISACSSLSPEQMVELYAKNGYTGVFVTDHFLNGNCMPVIKAEKDFKKQIEMFFKGYEAVKEVAKDKLDVFCGFEVSYKGTDVLVYGWNEETTKKYPEIMDMTMREFIEFANSHGATTVQAHPFREAEYIDHIRLFPGTQGVEIYNSSRDDLSNGLAYEYYKAYNAVYGKLKTGGSDSHSIAIKNLSGMAFDTKIQSEADFIKKLKTGEGEIFRKRNILVK